MRDHHLLRLAQVYAATLGITLTATAYRATGGTNSHVFANMLQGRRIHATTRAKLTAYFRSNWPPFLPWPEGVPRHPRRTGCRAVGRPRGEPRP